MVLLDSNSGIRTWHLHRFRLALAASAFLHLHPHWHFLNSVQRKRKWNEMKKGNVIHSTSSTTLSTLKYVRNWTRLRLDWPADKLTAANCQFDWRSAKPNRNSNGSIPLANPITSAPPSSDSQTTVVKKKNKKKTKTEVATGSSSTTENTIKENNTRWYWFNFKDSRHICRKPPLDRKTKTSLTLFYFIYYYFICFILFFKCPKESGRISKPWIKSNPAE